MASKIMKCIKDGDFQTVTTDVDDTLSKLNSTKQVEEILLLCSHFVCGADVVSLDQYTHMIMLLDQCILHSDKKSFRLSLKTKFMAYFYVLVYGCKKFKASSSLFQLIMKTINCRMAAIKGLCCDLIFKISSTLASIIEEEVKGSVAVVDLFKNVYSSLLNASRQSGIDASDSLRLQSLALSFLCYSNEPLPLILKRCLQLGQTNEKSSPSDLAFLYEKLMRASHHCIQIKSLEMDAVIDLNNIMLQYVKQIIILQSYSEYSQLVNQSLKPFVLRLESMCTKEIVMSFKMSVNITEEILTLVQKKHKEDELIKRIKTLALIPLHNDVANSVITDCLVEILYHSEDKSRFYSDFKASSSLFQLIMKTINCRMAAIKVESAIKVVNLYGNQLNSYLSILPSAEMEKKEEIMNEALLCCKELQLFKILKSPSIEKSSTIICNIGIYNCNMGVYCYKYEKHDMAVSFLEVGVKYLLLASSVSAKVKDEVEEMIKKRESLLKDIYRVCGRYKEGGLKALELTLRGSLSDDDFITYWIKCKRDENKAGKTSIKGLTVKDLYKELLEGEGKKYTKKISIEELLVKEVNSLMYLSYFTLDEKLASLSVLKDSANWKWKIEGHLLETIILYNHQNEEKNPLKSSILTLVLLEKCWNKLPKALFLELKARAYFWFYLCRVLEIQVKTEAEMKLSEKNSQADKKSLPGEELQPNDECSVRPSTSANTFPNQKEILDPIHKSLESWQKLIKIGTIDKPFDACQTLQSIAYVFNLYGLLPSTLKAITLLISISNKFNLKKYWMIGMNELLNLVPELISEEVVQHMLDVVEKEPDKLSDQVCNYFKFEVLISSSYYYYKHAEYFKGAKLLKRCFVKLLMDKNTASANEVQLEAFFVASLYYPLPEAFLPTEFKPDGTLLILSLKAAKKAIGLILLNSNKNNGVVCWQHRLAWQHHKTNMSYGRLCHIIGQPRQARAYIRQALSLAEKLALPLRTAECLSLLAEVDLLCDQIEDCRVKIDSLDFLFKVHELSSPLLETNDSEKLCLKTPTREKNSKSPTINIYVDDFDEERMRELSDSPDFQLAPLAVNGVVIGEPDRISQLAHPYLCPLSPSMSYREQKYTPRSLTCPLGINKCEICFCSEMLSLSVQISTLMAFVHCQQSNTKGALHCLEQASNQLINYKNVSSQITSNYVAILEEISDTNCKILLNNERHPYFMESKICSTKFRCHFIHQEILILENLFREAQDHSQDSLKDICKTKDSIVVENQTAVLQLVLQSKKIDKLLQEQEEIVEDSDEEDLIKSCSPLSSSKTTAGDMKKFFKTPRRPISSRHIDMKELINPRRKRLLKRSANKDSFPNYDDSSSEDSEVDRLEKSFSKLVVDEKISNIKSLTKVKFSKEVKFSSASSKDSTKSFLTEALTDDIGPKEETICANDKPKVNLSLKIAANDEKTPELQQSLSRGTRTRRSPPKRTYTKRKNKKDLDEGIKENSSPKSLLNVESVASQKDKIPLKKKDCSRTKTSKKEIPLTSSVRPSTRSTRKTTAIQRL